MCQEPYDVDVGGGLHVEHLHAAAVDATSMLYGQLGRISRPYQGQYTP